MWTLRATNLPVTLGALGVAGFSVTHSLPGTGALRTFCLLLCCVYLVSRWRFPRHTDSSIPTGPLTVLLVVLTLWMGLRTAYMSQWGGTSFFTFLGEWGRVLLVGGLGVGMALKAPPKEARVLFAAIFSGLFVHVLATLAFQPWGWYTQRHLVLTLSLLGNYGYVSPLVDAALAIILADIAQRIVHGAPLLPVNNKCLGWLLGLALLASLLLAAKSSAVVTVVLSILFVWAIFLSKSKYRRKTLFAVFGILLLSAFASVKTENRWQNVTESIRYAMDVDSNRDWVNSGYAETRPDIDGSFYLRAAWMKIGVQGVIQNPLGLGYGADAFGRYVKSRFGLPDAISSHSGWLDFTLANGVPGLVLLLSVGATLVARSWQRFKSGVDMAGLTLAFLSASFYCRGLLDGHFSASRMAGFSLMAGLLWGLMLRGGEKNNGDMPSNTLAAPRVE